MYEDESKILEINQLNTDRYSKDEKNFNVGKLYHNADKSVGPTYPCMDSHSY